MKKLLKELKLDIPFSLKIARKLQKKGYQIKDTLDVEELEKQLYQCHKSLDHIYGYNTLLNIIPLKNVNLKIEKGSLQLSLDKQVVEKIDLIQHINLYLLPLEWRNKNR